MVNQSWFGSFSKEILTKFGLQVVHWEGMWKMQMRDWRSKTEKSQQKLEFPLWHGAQEPNCCGSGSRGGEGSSPSQWVKYLMLPQMKCRLQLHLESIPGLGTSTSALRKKSQPKVCSFPEGHCFSCGAGEWRGSVLLNPWPWNFHVSPKKKKSTKGVFIPRRSLL